MCLNIPFYNLTKYGKLNYGGRHKETATVNVVLTMADALTGPPQLSLTVAVSLSRPPQLIVTYKYPPPPVLSKSFARFISTSKGCQISSAATASDSRATTVFLTSGTLHLPHLRRTWRRAPPSAVPWWYFTLSICHWLVDWAYGTVYLIIYSKHMPLIG